MSQNVRDDSMISEVAEVFAVGILRSRRSDTQDEPSLPDEEPGAYERKGVNSNQQSRKGVYK